MHSYDHDEHAVHVDHIETGAAGVPYLYLVYVHCIQSEQAKLCAIIAASSMQVNIHHSE